ncbi:MAG: MoaD/ThiS family protein [Bryobacterales bacterium]|nr:MoaD/ThiS family protein [Bryobacterales bacterium]
MLRPLAGGRDRVAVEGATVRQVIDNLEKECPGIKDRLVENNRLKANISVAVDDEILPLGLVEAVAPDSEIHFVQAITGGR